MFTNEISANKPLRSTEVKEFQKNGKLHIHALITAFIPWNVIKYFWTLATNGTSNIVWIANAQVQHTAAYMSKYMSKNLSNSCFIKGERRYGMSKEIRKKWPKLKNELIESYDFTYKPDNSNILKNYRNKLAESINH